MQKIIGAGFLAAGAVTLALTGTAGAQGTNTEDDGAVLLDTILVTAGLTPVEKEKSGRAFTVITGEELAERNVRQVSDALRAVPGFAVSQLGSAGGQTQIRVRGAEANHLLVMIDGIEVSETSTGEYDFGGLIVDNIDRIEVLRGPQSAFWGSNATAGVVNIITKGGIRNGFEATGTVEGGSDKSAYTSLGLRGGGENYDISLAAALDNTGGFNISDFGSQEDGSRNGTLNAKVNVDLTDWIKFASTLRYVNRQADTDAQDFTWMSPTYGLILDTDDETKMEELFGSVGLTATGLDGALTQKLRFSGSETRRDNLESGVVTSATKGARLNGSYQATYAFDTANFLSAHHSFTGGYEWQRETFRPSHLDYGFSRDAHSFVAEYRGEFLDQFYLNGAVRHDLNDRFDDATTFSVAGAWKLHETGTRFHTSVGTGITNPTFYELYGYTPTTFIGNPDLTPEKSLGWDVGVEQSFFDKRFVVDVTYFQQDLTDEIATVYQLVGMTYVSTPINREGKSQRQGVEVSATAELLDGLTANGTYTYTNATEQTVAGGARLAEVRRPKHAGSLNLAYSFLDDKARVFGEAIFNGTMFDNSYVTGSATRVSLDSYAVLNVGANYKFNDNYEVYGRVDNLLDTDYEEVFGYNTKGLTAYVGVKGRF
ncbi:TonB-dependent receptor [Breoghania sp.]|uniref:TonB-dependent receptor plug domain-containing protein n=1 Tax=Breoghania sp. TaxID=2065378 RepID=UPI002AA6A8A0|nr:TonB-dependent receptor [Breoghania sp.]